MNNLDFLDVISIVSFVIGLANYDENVNQGDIQKLMKEALIDIHSHLDKQDNKIDMILERINKGEKYD